MPAFSATVAPPRPSSTRWPRRAWYFSNAIVAGDVSGCSPGNGSECRILRVSCDFRNGDVVLSGHQQARAVALVPTPDGLYFSSDTPLEPNHVYRLDREGEALLTRSRRSELAGAS